MGAKAPDPQIPIIYTSYRDSDIFSIKNIGELPLYKNIKYFIKFIASKELPYKSLYLLLEKEQEILYYYLDDTLEKSWI